MRLAIFQSRGTHRRTRETWEAMEADLADAQADAARWQRAAEGYRVELADARRQLNTALAKAEDRAAQVSTLTLENGRLNTQVKALRSDLANARRVSTTAPADYDTHPAIPRYDPDATVALPQVVATQWDGRNTVRVADVRTLMDRNNPPGKAA